MFITTKWKRSPGPTQWQLYFNTWNTATTSSQSSSSSFYAYSFMQAAGTQSWFDKILYLVPMLGKDSIPPMFSYYTASQLVPIIDRNNNGTAYYRRNTADNTYFSESIGWSIDESTIYSRIYPKSSSGIGMYVISGSVSSPDTFFGNTNYTGSHRVYTTTSHPSTHKRNICATIDGTSLSVSYEWRSGFAQDEYFGNLYSQRISTGSLELYDNGILRVTGSSNIGDTISGSVDYTIGVQYTSPLIVGMYYETNGQLTETEVLQLHNTIKTYLISASGKRQ